MKLREATAGRSVIERIATAAGVGGDPATDRPGFRDAEGVVYALGPGGDPLFLKWFRECLGGQQTPVGPVAPGMAPAPAD